jgi:hypothetical protein
MKTLQDQIRDIKRFRNNVDRVSSIASKKFLEALRLQIVEGLLKSNLVSPPLKQKTIDSKIRKGMPRPKTPLLGWYLRVNSMVNGLQIKKIGKKFTLEPTGVHHSKKKQILLWMVHEYGAVIQKGDKLIKIPPRKPFKKGYQRFLNSAKKQEITENMLKYIGECLKGNKKEMDRIQKSFESKTT